MRLFGVKDGTGQIFFHSFMCAVVGVAYTRPPQRFLLLSNSRRRGVEKIVSPPPRSFQSNTKYSFRKKESNYTILQNLKRLIRVVDGRTFCQRQNRLFFIFFFFFRRYLQFVLIDNIDNFRVHENSFHRRRQVLFFSIILDPVSNERDKATEFNFFFS